MFAGLPDTVAEWESKGFSNGKNKRPATAITVFLQNWCE